MAVTVELTAFNLNIDFPLQTDVHDDPHLATSLIHEVCREGDLLSLEALEAAKQNIDCPDALGKRPMHEAAFFGHEDIVMFLLQSGAILDAPIPMIGHTALSMAVEANQNIIVKKLIDLGANISVENLLNQNGLLHMAAEKNNSIIAGYLITAGINIFKENRYGQTARDIAAKHGHKDLERALLKVMQHHARH